MLHDNAITVVIQKVYGHLDHLWIIVNLSTPENIGLVASKIESSEPEATNIENTLHNRVNCLLRSRILRIVKMMIFVWFQQDSINLEPSNTMSCTSKGKSEVTYQK